MTILYLKQVIFMLFLFILRPVIGAGLIDKAGITVTSSSTHIQDGTIPWGPNLAVDGDARRVPNVCNCCSSTQNRYEPWYRVDLGQVFNIQFVDVIGRGGEGDPHTGSGHTLQNMKVTYGINTNHEKDMFNNSAAVFVVYHNISTSIPGRYMELKLVGTTLFFVICEIFVYSECDDGRYGRDCVTCGACLDDAPCNKVDGTCTSCAAGYKGRKCDQECTLGEYGPDCRERCGNCKNDMTCSGSNGSCTECQQGYLIPLCKDCLDGRYGVDCSLTCGNCVEGSTCKPVTGACPQGCSRGYNGTHCDTKCPAGTFGKDCMSTCGNCFSCDVCRFDNGHCERGCEPGLQPPTCLKECSHGHYGANCLEQCGFCKDNVTCNRVDGSCVECAAGYMGVMCKQKPNECNCNEEKGQLLAAAIGGTVGAILFLEAAIVIVILLWRKRSKNKHQDTSVADTATSATTTTPTTEGFYEMPDLKATEEENLYGAALAQQITESNNVYANDKR